MARAKALTREQIVSRAYALACERGLSALSVRALAAECGVALGTIYNYFPTKGDLLNGVVGRFWLEELGSDMHEGLEPGMDYVAFCRAFFADVAEALVRFRRDWLPQLAAAGEASMADCPEAIRALDHMRVGLTRVLEADPRIDRSRLTGDLSPERVAALTLATVMELTSGFGATSTPAESVIASASDEGADDLGASCAVVAAGPATGEAGGFASFETFCRMLRLALYAAGVPAHRETSDETPVARTYNEKKSGS